jgi:hypothetical protein
MKASDYTSLLRQNTKLLAEKLIAAEPYSAEFSDLLQKLVWNRIALREMGKIFRNAKRKRKK